MNRNFCSCGLARVCVFWNNSTITEWYNNYVSNISSILYNVLPLCTSWMFVSSETTTFCGNEGYTVCVLKDIQYLYCKPRETTDGNIIIYNIPLSHQFLMCMPSCVWSPLLYIKINHHCFIWYLVWFIIYISIHLCLFFCIWFNYEGLRIKLFQLKLWSVIQTTNLQYIPVLQYYVLHVPLWKLILYVFLTQ